MKTVRVKGYKRKKREPNYFEFLVLPVKSKIQGIGFRPFIVEHSVEFNVVTVPINYPGGEVFIQVWGREDDAMAFKRFLEENKPKKANYKVVLISKSYRTRNEFKVLYFIDSLVLSQARKGANVIAMQARNNGNNLR